MYKPSSILTMTTYNGKTHLEIEEEFAIEQKRRFIEFIASPIMKELTKKFGEDLMKEYHEQQRHKANSKTLR
jgi:hypothetical protein